VAVTQRLRFEILKRDNHTCRYCGATAADAKITVDHVIPVALGGKDDPTNLVAACHPCNAGKSSVPPNAETVAQVADDAFRFASALEQVTARRRAAVAEMVANVAWFDQQWKRWTYLGRDGQRHVNDRDDDWAVSMERFFALGLNRADIERLINVAMGFTKAWDTWRFFCGKAWQEIRERQDEAREALTAAATDTYDQSSDYAKGYDDGFDDSAGYWASRERQAIAGEIEEAYERGFRDGVARAKGALPEPLEISDIDDGLG
jgi:hypothetical protein